MSFLQELTEGKIDFAGQQHVEMLSKFVLVVASVLSFLLGFALQDIRVTFGILGLTTVVLALVVLPPWPMFNKHPVRWLSSVEKPQTQ